MGIATAGDSRDIQYVERIPRDVCGDASDGVVFWGGVVGDFTSSVQTHAFLIRQSKCRGLSDKPRVPQKSKAHRN